MSKETHLTIRQGKKGGKRGFLNSFCFHQDLFLFRKLRNETNFEWVIDLFIAIWTTSLVARKFYKTSKSISQLQRLKICQSAFLKHINCVATRVLKSLSFEMFGRVKSELRRFHVPVLVKSTQMVGIKNKWMYVLFFHAQRSFLRRNVVCGKKTCLRLFSRENPWKVKFVGQKNYALFLLLSSEMSKKTTARRTAVFWMRTTCFFCLFVDRLE